jgi:hypothetical protein
MPYAPFFEKFPEIAARETRVLHVLNLPGLPPGEYGLLELYCNEINCDCRRVIFDVTEAASGQSKAVIGFGWESSEFYARWLGRNEPAALRELQGPALNTMSRQSELAPILLQQVILILQDEKYVERIKRHYAMYKAVIDPRLARRSARSQATNKPQVRAKRKKRKKR